MFLEEDQKPWLDIARQVLRGEFEHADKGLVKSILYGLEGIARHPEAAKAIERLERKNP